MPSKLLHINLMRFNTIAIHQTFSRRKVKNAWAIMSSRLAFVSSQRCQKASKTNRILCSNSLKAESASRKAFFFWFWMLKNFELSESSTTLRAASWVNLIFVKTSPSRSSSTCFLTFSDESSAVKWMQRWETSSRILDYRKSFFESVFNDVGVSFIGASNVFVLWVLFCVQRLKWNLEKAYLLKILIERFCSQ